MQCFVTGKKMNCKGIAKTSPVIPVFIKINIKANQNLFIWSNEDLLYILEYNLTLSIKRMVFYLGKPDYIIRTSIQTMDWMDQFVFGKENAKIIAKNYS